MEADAAAAAAARARLNPNAPNRPNLPDAPEAGAAAADARRKAEAAQRNAAEQARDRAPDVRRDAERAAEQARDRTNDARRSADEARRDAAEAAQRNALDPAQRRAAEVRREAERAADQARDRTNDARRSADEARRDAAEAAQRNALDPAQRRAAEVRRDAERAAEQARDRANDVRRDANQDARRAEERADDVRRDANEARRDANQDARRSSRIANDPFGPNGFLRRPSDLDRDGVRDPNRRPLAIGGPNRFGPGFAAGRGFSIGVGPVGVDVGPRGGVDVNIGRGPGVTVNALRPAWSGDDRGWQDTWRSHGVPHYHRNWYHGAWGQNGRATYSPWLWNSGLGWGYGWGNLGLNSGYYAYSNPYYTSQQAAVYDYSQPVQVAYYAEEAQQPAQDQPAYALFDQGREAFRNQDFGTAMRLFDQAAEKLPGDALIHEARALNLFALKRYPEAAGVLNSLLSSAPGWNWQSMLAFYPSVEVYTPQLRALEDFRRGKPDDAASRFVLAYHYQVQGHPDAAARELRRVVELQPGDMVAVQMLKALEAPAPDAAAAQNPANAPLEPAAAVDPAAAPPADAPQTDLVGKWIGKRQDSIYHVTLADDGKFTWMAKRENAAAGSKLPDLQGQYAVDQNTIVMEDGQGGTMVGQLTAKGPDEFVFTMMGAPQDDPGITFRRNRG